MKLKEPKKAAPPTPQAEIPLAPAKTLDEQEAAANEMAAEIIEIMQLFARAHGKLQEIRASDQTLNKFRQLVRQTYTNLKADIPSLWRPELVKEIESEFES